MVVYDDQNIADREAELRKDLSPGLIELDGQLPLEQAAFWASCVDGTIGELERIGGLPEDSVFNDVLTRYFDASTRAMNVVFDAAYRDQPAEVKEATGKELLSKPGFLDALTEHYDLYPNEKHEGFQKVCQVVGMPCSRASFAYAIRRIRMAVLLSSHHMRPMTVSKSHRKTWNEEGNYIGTVYHFDYDDDDLYNFAHAEKRCQVQNFGTIFHIPKLPKQAPIHDIGKYLFTSKATRSGRVHWSHLHFPSPELVLAICQVWRVSGFRQNLFCNLRTAQTQIELSANASRCPDTSGERYMWSSMVMPGIFLDRTSRESLELYRNWAAMRRNPTTKAKVSVHPPPIRIAAVQSTIGLLWSDVKENTLVSMVDEPVYIGKWNSDAPYMSQKSGMTKLLDMLLTGLTCGCCCRQSNTYGSADDPRGQYSKLNQQDPGDVEANVPEKTQKVAGFHVSEQLHAALTEESVTARNVAGEIASDEEESCCSFDRCFEKVLVALDAPNSMLRLSSHFLLLTRIALNRTADFLDVLEVYEAAITRISYLLHERETRDKDELIANIAQMKSDLGHLERVVRPFANHVVPTLSQIAPNLPRDFPLVHHQVQDIQHNCQIFGPKCKSLTEKCVALSQEYDRIASDKMNDILNLLTFITFIITPVQILTGLYGMNFRIMPELGWKYGYAYFWGLSTSLTVLFALVLVCLKRQND